MPVTKNLTQPQHIVLSTKNKAYTVRNSEIIGQSDIVPESL
jgi:hypothetical protein